MLGKKKIGRKVVTVASLATFSYSFNFMVSILFGLLHVCPQGEMMSAD